VAEKELDRTLGHYLAHCSCCELRCCDSEVGEDGGGETKHLFTSTTPQRLRGAEVAAGGVCGGPFDGVQQTLLLRRAQDDGAYGGGVGGGA